MFSFIRWIYRRIYITILLFMQTLSELIDSPESDGELEFRLESKYLVSSSKSG